MNELVFFIIIIGFIILEEYVMTNTRYFWLGGLLPLLGIISIISIMIYTSSYKFSDIFLVLISIFALLVVWGDGANRHNKKIKKQKAKMLKKDIK